MRRQSLGVEDPLPHYKSSIDGHRISGYKRNRIWTKPKSNRLSRVYRPLRGPKCQRENVFFDAQRPVICSSFSGYRAPCTVILEAASSMARRSSGVSSTEAAPMFSSKRCRFVVPGIGTIHGFWASSQAIASWAGVACFCAAILPSRSIKAWFALSASGVKRGRVLRKSELSKVAFSSILPVRNVRFRRCR